jgi:hypothetical protein
MVDLVLGLRSAAKTRVFFAGIIATVILGTIGFAQATTINFELGNSPRLTSKVSNTFDVLNGMPLQRQHISLDITFPSNEFVRLFTVTNNLFEALLKLQTTDRGFPEFLKGTGYLIDQNGNPVEPPEKLGLASEDNGILAAGLLPLLSGDLQRPVDFFGIHLDLKLPRDRFVSITGGELMLTSEPRGPFGVGPGVPPDVLPDQDGTLVLLSLSLLGLILARFPLTQLS